MILNFWLAFAVSVFAEDLVTQKSFLFQKPTESPRIGVLDFFISNVTQKLNMQLDHSLPYLHGLVHYRNIPGIFYPEMGYHFDGLAHVLKLNFTHNHVRVDVVPFKSAAFDHHCIFAGTGVGPYFNGGSICVTNPGVNFLPMDDQNLWLTIDTANWGLVDPFTLETKQATIDVPSFTLNAHPACDEKGCFVEHACAKGLPLSKRACISKLVKTETGLKTETLSSVEMPNFKLIQHSHAPCLTDNFIVVKLDAFKLRTSPTSKNAAGMLAYLQQEENNLFMVMNRHTNNSKIMKSNVNFVNNHFWNCFEESGSIVVDSVPATQDYLDQYFHSNLQMDTNWTRIFMKPIRCKISVALTGTINCEDLLSQDDQTYFDYPTFNPLVKKQNSTFYQHFYAISPSDKGSKWFDQIIKVRVDSGKIVTRLKLDGVYFTEPSFVPLSSRVLISVGFHSKQQTSLVFVIDACSLQVLDSFPLNMVVPFHAHGVSRFQKTWYTNP
jgi:carotenoid cleavage dioxygenase-like enzyme